MSPAPCFGGRSTFADFSAERLGDAVSHQEIRDYVWGENWAGGDEALRVAVNRLRKKFEGNQRRPQILVSVRGIGYRLIGTRQA